MPKWWKTLEDWGKPKSSDARNCNNEIEKVFSEDFNMKSQSSAMASINFHKVTQDTSLAIQNCLSNLTNTTPICISLETTIHQDSKRFENY